VCQSDKHTSLIARFLLQLKKNYSIGPSI
jgi:hypothetical protein